MSPQQTEVRCSFCGDPPGKSEGIVSGVARDGHTVSICWSCIDVCGDIVLEHRAEIAAQTATAGEQFDFFRDAPMFCA